MTRARIDSMIEEHEFDDLYELVSRGNTVFSRDEYPVRENLFYKLVEEGLGAKYEKERLASIRLIEFLLSDEDHMPHPYYRTHVLKASAACGHVFLLEAICSKGWHRSEDFGDILLSSCDSLNEAIPVLTWLQKNRKKYFQNIVSKETTSIDIALGDALSNELIRSAQFILENKEQLGYENWTPDKIQIVMSTADEGATPSLDFLAELWGYDFVVGIVTEYIKTDDFEPYYLEKTELWLRKQSRTLNKRVIKKHLQKAIEKLDTVKETLQEGDYLTIVNHMAKAYDACK